jgi:hypothetical protein
LPRFHAVMVQAFGNFILSEGEKLLCIALAGTMRRLLDSVALRIVIVDPVFPFSLKDSQLRLPFYPLPAARVFYARRGIQKITKSGANLKTICLDELLATLLEISGNRSQLNRSMLHLLIS